MGLTDGLLAAYRFDGDLTDSSGNGNDLSGSAAYTTGLLGQAVISVGAFGSAASGGALLSGSVADAALTVAGWFRRSGTTAGVLFALEDSGGDPVPQLGIVGTDLRAVFGSGGSAVTLSAGAATAGQWHHLAVTLSGGTATLYLDGAEADSADVSAAAAGRSFGGAGSTTLVVGGSPVLGYRADMACVYGRALTAAEVAQLYNGGAGLDPTDPVPPVTVTFSGTATISVTFSGTARVSGTFSGA